MAARWTHRLIFLLILLSPSALLAEVYRYIDEDGVVSFTNDLDLIPEPYRSSAHPIKEGDLPTLGIRSNPGEPKPEASWKSWSLIPPAYLGTGIVFVLILVVLYRYGATGAMIKVVFTLLFISLIGATVYSLLFTKSKGPKPAVESMAKELKKASPIHRARDAVDEMNQQQEKQSDMIQLLHSPDK